MAVSKSEKSENITAKDENEFCNCNVIHEDVVNYVRERMLEQMQFEKLKMCVCDLAALLGMTASAISHQLRVLRQAELVRSEKQGKVVYYMLSDNHVNTVFSNALEHIME